MTQDPTPPVPSQVLTDLSVVIVVKNEEAHLPDLLAHVRDWTREVVVVDMQSTDRTRELALAAGARVASFEDVGYADPARSYAVGLARSEWILMLDADERVPPSLRRHIARVIAEDGADVVVMPWKNYLLGAHITHTGWGMRHDFHPRLFKRSAMQLSGEVHNFMHAAPDARVLRFPPTEEYAVTHFNYVDITQFVEKLNRYTSAEAQRLGPSSVGRALMAGTVEFGRRYVRHAGYRDGWRGLALSLLMAMYMLVAHLKRVERDRNGDREAVRAAYARISADIVAAHAAQDRDDA